MIKSLVIALNTYNTNCHRKADEVIEKISELMCDRARNSGKLFTEFDVPSNFDANTVNLVKNHFKSEGFSAQYKLTEHGEYFLINIAEAKLFKLLMEEEEAERAG